MQWFIADTHFGHENVIKYDNRPFKSAIDMETEIIKRWNNNVKPSDTVYHLGDFAFLSTDLQASILKELNGRKILIRGNHDKSQSACERAGWDYVCDGLLITLNGLDILCIHDPSRVSNSNYFSGFVLHGHTHKSNSDTNRLCVSCNLWDYAPVSEKQVSKAVIEKLKERNNWLDPITP